MAKNLNGRKAEHIYIIKNILNFYYSDRDHGLSPFETVSKIADITLEKIFCPITILHNADQTLD